MNEGATLCAARMATASAGRPWVCNVWFASDEDMNIYWFSSVTRRHSKEVKQNSHVAGSMCLPQTPQDKPRGLQFEGVAEALTSKPDIQKATSVYRDRIFSEAAVRELMTHPDRPYQFYRIAPSLFVLFDVEHFPEESRQEWRPSA